MDTFSCSATELVNNYIFCICKYYKNDKVNPKHIKYMNDYFQIKLLLSGGLISEKLFY